MIPALVLAAGKSTRMGTPKATLSLGPGETFIGRIVGTFRAADVDEVVVVLGHEAEAVQAAMQAGKVQARVVVNAAFEEGQFSSLLAGLRVIDRPGVSGMLLTLVDVPLVSAQTVRAVIERHRRTHAPVVRPVRGTEHGHPVLIDRSLFGRLHTADPRLGAKPIVRQYASPQGDVEVDDEGSFLDVDTPEDYKRALGLRR